MYTQQGSQKFILLLSVLHALGDLTVAVYLSKNLRVWMRVAVLRLAWLRVPASKTHCVGTAPFRGWWVSDSSSWCPLLPFLGCESGRVQPLLVAEHRLCASPLSLEGSVRCLIEQASLMDHFGGHDNLEKGCKQETHELLILLGL